MRRRQLCFSQLMRRKSHRPKRFAFLRHAAKPDSKNGDTGRRLIIKMDIEGGEWESLLATPDELLTSIPQLAMEMHGFDDPRILEVLRKLNRNFYLVNLHFNNWSCTSRAAPLPAWAYQVLWVNKRIGIVDPMAPVPAPMSPLNAPDSPTWSDCQLRISKPAR